MSSLAARAAPQRALLAAGPALGGWHQRRRRQRQRQTHHSTLQQQERQPLAWPQAAAAAAGGNEQAPGADTAAGWQAAQAEVQAQQAAGLSAPYPLDKTRQLVETAMLAAVTALAYTVGSLLRVEAYMAYVLPLPVVLAALRSGPGPAVKTLTAAVLLLLILMGPVRAVTYLLVYGVLSLALGASWAAALPWGLSIPVGALARIGGYLAYIALSSWVTNENLLMLMLSNVYSLLDQLSAVLGTTGAPPLLAVGVVLCSLLFVNSLMYVALMHLLYAIMLRGMGLTLPRMPAFAQRAVGQLPEV